MTDAAKPVLDGVAWPNASSSQIVTSGGLHWHIQQLGQGPAMFLIHGTGASTHSWEGLVEALKTDFALTIVDLPGHGFTGTLPRSQMTLDSMARLLAGLLQTIGVAPAIIIGHSAGAAIAIRMALAGYLPSLRVIVSVNGALLPWRGVARWLFPPLARMLSAGPVAAHLLAQRAARPGTVARMLAGTGALPPPRSVGYYERLLKRRSHVQAALDMMAKWDLETLARDLPNLRVRLELIACGGDKAVPSDTAFAVEDVVSAARVHFIRGLGHLAHEESPADIARIVREAWRAHGRPGASSGGRQS